LVTWPPREGLDLQGAPQRHPLFLYPLADGRRGDAQQPRQIFAIAAGGGAGFVESGIGHAAFLSKTFNDV